MADHANQGDKASGKSQYDEAITHYTAAIKESPEAPTFYTKRSTAYARVNAVKEALVDAEKAVVLATKRSRREQIAEAQHRRAVALWCLKRYGDADFVFSIAKPLAKPKTKALEEEEQKKQDNAPDRNISALDKQMNMWEGRINRSLQATQKEKDELDKKREKGMGDDDDMTLEEWKKILDERDEKLKKILEVTVKEMPDISTAAPPSATQTSSTTKTETAPPAAPKPTQTPTSQIRHQWYQFPATVTISVVAKGIPADKYAVDIQERSLEISFPLASGSDYQLQFDPLFAAVDVSKSTYKLSPTKLEITLKKSVEGQKWPALEGTAGTTTSTTTTTTGINAAARSAALSNITNGPSYPTSSKSGPKNWDKIAKSYAKPPKSAKTGSKNGAGTPPSSDDDGNDSDADKAKDTSKTTATSKPKQKKKTTKKDPDDPIYVSSDSDAGDEVNGFFKTMYKNADPDTRRAMMKSYQESGGTALSTNWDEVSKGTVPVSPPDGMEEKKY